MSYARYPAYKDSGIAWLGEVPEHWNATRIQYYAKVLTGGTPDRNNPAYWEHGTINWMSSGEVNKGYIYEVDGKITEEGLKNSNARLLAVNSVMIALNGQGKTKGMVAVLKTKSTCNQSLAAIECDEQKLNYQYLYFYLQSRYLDLRGLVGDDARDGLNLSLVKNIPIYMPLIWEQAAIASFLDRETAKIDALIAKQERLIALLQEKRQALISHAVTKGLNPAAPMKDSGVEWLGEIPAHWVVYRNKVLFREVDDRSTTGEEELLTVSHITGVTPRSEKTNVTMFMAETLKGYKRCSIGDLIINTMWAWMGALGTTTYDGVVSPSYNVYRLRTEGVVEPKFYDLLCRTPAFVTEIRRHSTGVWESRLRLYPAAFFDMRVALPPIEEQREICDAVKDETTQIDAIVDKTRQAIDLLREHRTSLISAAVTGKIDVRQYAEVEALV